MSDLAQRVEAFIKHPPDTQAGAMFGAERLLIEQAERVEALEREKAAMLNFIDSQGISRDEVDGFMEGNLVRSWASLGEKDQKCPNALLPDGPVCPRCGGPRGPSGVDGGSWVHIREASLGEML